MGRRTEQAAGATAPMTIVQRVSNFVRRVVRKARNILRGIRRALDGSAQAPTASAIAVEAPPIALNEVRDAIRQLRAEVTAQISFLAHDLSRQFAARDTAPGVAALSERLNLLDSGINTRLNSINTLAFETQNRLIHLDTSLNTRFNTLEFVHLPALTEQVHEAGQLALSLRGGAALEATSHSRPEPTGRLPFDAVLNQAKRDYRGVFDAWKERLDEISRDFDVTKTGNAANAADLYSRLFKAFVESYARGSVLDIGCGPFGKPFYLNDYPSRLVSGLEPLSTKTEHVDIDLVRGISEYLPWPDRSFDTVISATSLDHCLDLQRSLEEMVRVMKAPSVALLWLGHIPGSPEFRPLDPGFTPADRFHLFHFDTSWFEPMLERHFTINNRVKLDRVGYSHIFYCLRPLS